MRTFATAWMIVCLCVFGAVLFLAALGIGELGTAAVGSAQVVYREQEALVPIAIAPAWTATETPTETPEPTAIDTPTVTSTATAIPSETATDIPTATDTPTKISTPTETVTPEPTATGAPTTLPTVTGTSTPIPIATTVGVDDGSSQPFVCTNGCATPPDPSCDIKGNVNSSGERIYHTPDGQFYDRTDIKPEEGDRWFCTIGEAEAAGFRQSER